MKDHAGTLDEVRAAIFAAKEERRRLEAHAAPEEKLAMLEAMQELARELREVTLSPAIGDERRDSGE